MSLQCKAIMVSAILKCNKEIITKQKKKKEKEEIYSYFCNAKYSEKQVNQYCIFLHHVTNLLPKSKYIFINMISCF